MTKVEITGQKDNRIVFFELSNEELRVKATNLGCHILSIFAKDRSGKAEDVVLGLEDLEDCYHDGTYMGAVVGRVANRIGGAKFDLNGETYHLAANNGPNSLHGGNAGFDQKVFEYEILENGVRFIYLSPDGEEGYPGSMYLKVTYLLEGNTLKLKYDTVSDQDTLVNITNHTYFNLTGGKDKIYHHQLKVAADQFACVDADCLATGEFRDVDGTPFDFRQFHEIGERIEEEEEQLKLAGGYDHSFVFDSSEDQAELYDPESGRKLVISTTLPAMQVYTGNFLAGSANGKHGKPYENRDGVALETQFLPNSIHIEKEPKVILRKGEQYQSETSFRFEVE